MKKIEKELLLMDLENGIIQYERKIKILDNIIIYYNDEDIEDDNINKTDLQEDIQNPDNSENNTDDNSESIEDDEDVEIESEKVEEEKEEVESIKKEDLLPQDIKVIYRKIMMMTHPDKNKGKPHEKEYANIYKDAVKAKNENDKAEIIYIAYKLNIKEVFDLNEEHFGTIKYKIAKLNIDARSVENSPYWVWYYTDNESLRNVMKKHINKFNKK